MSTPKRVKAWYVGPTLMEWLETVQPPTDDRSRPFRMPIQWVNRANSGFRGLAGTIAAGRVRAGDKVAITNQSRVSTIARIATMEGDLAEAIAGQAATLVLRDDLDAGRGDMLFDPAAPPAVADQFAANLVWMGEDGLLPHRNYLMRIGTELVPAEITALKYRLNVDSLAHEAAIACSPNARRQADIAARGRGNDSIAPEVFSAPIHRAHTGSVRLGAKGSPHIGSVGQAHSRVDLRDARSRSRDRGAGREQRRARLASSL